MLAITLQAQVENPQLLNHQGRIAVDGVNFQGTGQFKFALINGTETVVWSNVPISAEVPDAAVALTVTKGLYSVLLGDTTLQNMAGVPALLFSDHKNLSLRVWFDDGSHGFQQITPDQRFAVAPFAECLAPNTSSSELSPLNARCSCRAQLLEACHHSNISVVKIRFDYLP